MTAACSEGLTLPPKTPRASGRTLSDSTRVTLPVTPLPPLTVGASSTRSSLFSLDSRGLLCPETSPQWSKDRGLGTTEGMRAAEDEREDTIGLVVVESLREGWTGLEVAPWPTPGAETSSVGSLPPRSRLRSTWLSPSPRRAPPQPGRTGSRGVRHLNYGRRRRSRLK